MPRVANKIHRRSGGNATPQKNSPIKCVGHPKHDDDAKRVTDKISGFPSTMTWERKRPAWRPAKRFRTVR